MIDKSITACSSALAIMGGFGVWATHYSLWAAPVPVVALTGAGFIFARWGLHKNPKPRLLYGVDLNQWYFLGYATPHYTDHAGNEGEKLHVALFSNREDESKRKLVPLGDKWKVERFADHPYYKLTLRAWAAGDGNLYRVCQHPSEDLKERMKVKGFVWDTNKNWWREQKFEGHVEDGTNVIKLTPKK